MGGELCYRLSWRPSISRKWTPQYERNDNFCQYYRKSPTWKLSHSRNAEAPDCDFGFQGIASYLQPSPHTHVLYPYSEKWACRPYIYFYKATVHLQPYTSLTQPRKLQQHIRTLDPPRPWLQNFDLFQAGPLLQPCEAQRIPCVVRLLGPAPRGGRGTIGMPFIWYICCLSLHASQVFVSGHLRLHTHPQQPEISQDCQRFTRTIFIQRKLLDFDSTST